MEFGKRLLVFLFIIILLGILAYYYPQLTGESVNNSNYGYQRESAFVTKIIDGDTLDVELNGNKERIRLFGINTPEKNKPYSKEAIEFLESLESREVELLRDKEDIDRYKRKLRYVFYKDSLINAEVLQKGLATSFMLDGLNYEIKLKKAENFAKNSKIGLWKASSGICGNCIELAELNAEKEYFIIRNICDFSCNLTGWFVKDDANHFFYLNDLDALSERTYYSNQDEAKKTLEVWNDNGDRFFMRDKNGDLVAFWAY